MRRFASILVIAGVLCHPVASALADNARKLVSKGNESFQAGDFDSALAEYEKASVEQPESIRIKFNKGAALYRKEDFDGAAQLFRECADTTDDVKFEARATYNLGNCRFRECERQLDSDLKKALAACETSIGLYQKAADLDPEFREAAENVEVARLTMKAILDEIKKQEEEKKKQQQNQQNAADKIKDMLNRQKQMNQQTSDMQDQQQKKSGQQGQQQQDQQQKKSGQQGRQQQKQNSQQNQDQQKKGQQKQSPQQAGQNKRNDDKSGQEQPQDLAERQKELGDESKDLSEQMNQQPQQAQQPKKEKQPRMQKASEHVKNASEHQQNAADELQGGNTDRARSEQDRATDELRKALDSLSNPQDNNQQQQQKQNNQQNQDQQKKDQQKQKKPGKKEQEQDRNKKQEKKQEKKQQQQGGKKEKKKEDVKPGQMNELARDIIEQEKKNKDRRSMDQNSGIRPVHRDW